MNDIPRQKLQYIISQYGRSVCDEPRRCEALLRDLCPEFKREINILIGALREKIPADLLSTSDTMPKQILLARLKKRLYDNLGIAEEFAGWAVESWASVLGTIPETKPVKKKITKGRSKRKAPGKPQKKYSVRNSSLTVSDEEFKKIFKLKDNCRPRKYVQNDYEYNGNGTITDRATGLVWQKSGSDMYITYDRAHVYIEELNKKQYAGYNDWRLPTVDELISLLEPEKQSDGLYIDPVFDSTQIWCWSSDKRSSGLAWYVGFNYGYVFSLDLEDGYYARAVRS